MWKFFHMQKKLIKPITWKCSVHMWHYFLSHLDFWFIREIVKNVLMGVFSCWKYGERTMQLVISSASFHVYICEWVCECVWQHPNDYYGLTPISWIVIRPQIFPFSWQWKGKHIPFCRLLLRPRLSLSHSETEKTHTLLLTHPAAHPQAHTQAHTGSRWRTNIWVYRVSYTEKGCEGETRVYENHQS